MGPPRTALGNRQSGHGTCLTAPWAYLPANSAFVRLTDWRELPGALFLYLLLAPVIWTSCLWQPRLILEVFAGARGGVVGAPRDAALLQAPGARHQALIACGRHRRRGGGGAR